MTFKPACNWGLQVLASYDMRPHRLRQQRAVDRRRPDVPAVGGLQRVGRHTGPLKLRLRLRANAAATAAASGATISSMHIRGSGSQEERRHTRQRGEPRDRYDGTSHLGRRMAPW